MLHIIKSGGEVGRNSYPAKVSDPRIWNLFNAYAKELEKKYAMSIVRASFWAN